MGFFSDHKWNPTQVWTFVSVGLYFSLPVMCINLEVLTVSGGMICSLVDPCLFGDTGNEPADCTLHFSFFCTLYTNFLLIYSVVSKLNNQTPRIESRFCYSDPENDVSQWSGQVLIILVVPVCH
jgi:hypothetical protein